MKKLKLKPNAPISWAIAFLELGMFFILFILFFSTFLWWNNFNLHFDDRFLKNSPFKQKIMFEGAGFFEKRNPANEWVVRIYNVDEISVMPDQEEPFGLDPYNKRSTAVFNPRYKTIELTTSSPVVHSLFSRIQLFAIINLGLMFMFAFMLRRILKAAKKEQPFSKRVSNAFRWMALILSLFCLTPYKNSDVLLRYVYQNIGYGTTYHLLSWQGNNTIMMLIIGALVLLCLAESFRQAAKLKEEQELTV